MDWNPIDNLDSVSSPGLLVDADRVAANIDSMIAILGRNQIDRLRPHVKTHKMPQVIRLKLAAGITKFKTATIDEAEMVAAAGGQDVLIAYQLVGPNIGRLQDLVGKYPATSFATIVDDVGIARTVAAQVGNRDRPLRMFIDVDCGMHRTGIPLGPPVDRLRDAIESLAGIQYAGLHLYDGHSHSPSPAQRRLEATRIIDQVNQYDRTNPSPLIVGGGSPTYATWAELTNWECSPGTPVFWDRNYRSKFAELPFRIAVALLVRVISKPGGNRLCFDLGYKAIAAEVPLPERVSIPALDDMTLVAHSEEHLVGESSLAPQIAVGQAFVAFPRHVCPTVALYDMATVIRDGRVTDETWRITARSRMSGTGVQLLEN